MAGFIWLFDCLVVWTLLLLLTSGQMGISKVEQKLTITEGGRKKRQNTDLRTVKCKKLRSGTILALSVYACVWPSQVHCEILNSYQRC